MMFPHDNLDYCPCIKFVAIYIPCIYYSCNPSNRNKLLLREIPSLAMAMTVCRMIIYCYSLLPGFKCIFFYFIVQDYLYHKMDIGTM